LILIGLNWWLKPFEYHPKDANSWFSRALKLLIKSTAITEQHTKSTPQLSHDFTPVSSESGSLKVVEYYQLSRPNPSRNSHRTTDMSSGKETNAM